MFVREIKWKSIKSILSETFFQTQNFRRNFQPLKKSYYVKRCKIIRRIHFWHLKQPEMRGNGGKRRGKYFSHSQTIQPPGPQTDSRSPQSTGTLTTMGKSIMREGPHDHHKKRSRRTAYPKIQQQKEVGSPLKISPKTCLFSCLFWDLEFSKKTQNLHS